MVWLPDAENVNGSVRLRVVVPVLAPEVVEIVPMPDGVNGVPSERNVIVPLRDVPKLCALTLAEKVTGVCAAALPGIVNVEKLVTALVIVMASVAELVLKLPSPGYCA